ncbi:MAG: transporter permease [Mycobacterium sp.]|jgi:hypothetical protein|nr:transporter permease [Mycobacterium sp.]
MSQVVAALAAERIKLFSTRAPWVALAGAAAVSVAIAALQAWGRGISAMAPQDAALGVALIAVPVLMVLASMTITGEFRSQMIRTTFLAVPDRMLVLGAKACVSAALSAVVVAGLVLVTALVAGLLAPPMTADALSPAGSQVWSAAGSFALYAAVAAVLGVGVGALIRAAPGTVAILLLWPLVIETVLGLLPGTGSRVGPYLPFQNVYTFIGVQWLNPGYDMPWGPVGGFVYFTVVTTVVFAAALLVVHRRDA